MLYNKISYYRNLTRSSCCLTKFADFSAGSMRHALSPRTTAAFSASLNRNRTSLTSAQSATSCAEHVGNSLIYLLQDKA